MKSTKTGATLSIAHSIHLTREQRYTLASGQEVNTVGISVPIWYVKGRTSEPGIEVFSNYKLSNTTNTDIDIEHDKDGYRINLPQAGKTSKKAEVSDEVWRQQNMAREYSPFYEGEIQTGAYLRDIEDGGAKRVFFSQYNRAKIRGLSIHLIHSVCITDLEELNHTIVNLPGCPLATYPVSN